MMRHLTMRHRPPCFALTTLLALALSACLGDGTIQPPGPYTQPAPAQLDPPPRYRLRPNTPLVGFNRERTVVEFPVAGDENRPLHALLAGANGQRKLAVLVGLDRHVVFAEPGFHLPPAGAADAEGDLMLCWNTLNGATSPHSPTTPDPSRGMTLHCRLLHADESLGPTRQIEVPTVGCWISKLVALPGGGFRLLYKGDDGWFEARYEKPEHGVYETFYAAGTWSPPALVVPVPDPTATQEIEERVTVDPPVAPPPAAP
jgi:hypothetical protein